AEVRKNGILNFVTTGAERFIACASQNDHAVSGQAMVSDNQDLGFIVADQNDTPPAADNLQFFQSAYAHLRAVFQEEIFGPVL
ncbi:hypothetical protein NQ253_26930, partial [Escherichia coli]|nr:hypothetical protein [Escherichia coli]